jgi:outer membrane protein assembly factor BamB
LSTYTYGATDTGVFAYDVRIVDDDGHETSVRRSVAIHRPHDWPGTGFDPGRTGWNPHTSGPTEDRIAWTADLFPDQRFGGGITAGPAVRNGTVFVGTYEEVRAYDAVTGRTEWSNATGAESILVWGDVLLVSGEETATAFDARTGEHLWQRDLPRAGTAERGRPAIYQGIAYFPRGLALDVRTGETVWTTPWEGNSLAIGGENVFFAFPTDGRLRALDRANGSVNWETQLDPSVGLGTPIVTNGTVFVGDENVTAVNASTGEIDWSRRIGENTSQHASPAVANGQVYLTTQNRSDSIGGRLYVVDADSGTLEWSATYPDWGRSSPAVADDVVYVGSDACEDSCDNRYTRPEGEIRAFDTRSGHELWNVTTEQGVTTSPAVSNGSLYVGNGKGVLLAFGENRGDTGGDASRTPTNVSLVPGETTVHPGEETEFTLVVENATEGIGSYTATIETKTPDTVAITAVQLAAGTEADAVSIAENNSVATIDTTGLNVSDTGTVSLATITVEGTAPGAAGLNLSVSALSGEAGDDYRVTDSRGVSSRVVPSPIGRFEKPPTDPDGDGVYEDINGNGEANVVDVQAMFANRNAPGLTEFPSVFDLSGNGEVDVVDVQALFAELSS